ncbi:MAG: SDR family oxidoreductase [Chloroflexi bacterium]|nr:SDR family oxidoreductase [Chloroflexota bacterium]
MTLKDRVAVVTGAAGELGQVVTRRLAEQGARLVLLGRRADRLEALARDLKLAEDRYLAHAVDLGNLDSARAAGAAAVERFGRAEILLQLVGGWTGGQTITEAAVDDVARMIHQHLWTTFYLAQAFVPHLTANGWGRLIVVSSPLASQPQAKSGPYAIGKAAQEALMGTLAQELRGSGVTANVLLVRAIDVKHERIRKPKPQNAGWTTPEEIASAILFLCTDEANMINGARIPLYGSPWP